MKCRDQKDLPRYMQTSPPHTEKDVNRPYWRNPTLATYWIRSDLRVVLTRIRISMSYWSKWNNPPPCRYHNVQRRIVGYKDGGNSTGDLEILIYRICSAPAMCINGKTEYHCPCQNQLSNDRATISSYNTWVMRRRRSERSITEGLPSSAGLPLTHTSTSTFAAITTTWLRRLFFY